MADILYSAICKGETSSADGNGRVIQRRYVVQLDRTPTTDIEIAQSIILAETATGIPAKYSQHPADPFLCCLDKRIQALDSNTFQVDVTFRRPNRPGDRTPGAKATAEFFSSVQTVATSRGRRVTPGYVENEFEEMNVRRYSEDFDGVGSYDHKAVVFQFQKSTAGLRFTRRETKNPLEKTLKFVGKVNADQFNSGVPRTWLCTRIQSATEDGGETYIVSYEFQHKSDGWQTRVYYTDSTGKPIPYAEQGKFTYKLGREIEDYLPYEEARFSELDLPDYGSAGDGDFIGSGLTA